MHPTLIEEEVQLGRNAHEIYQALIGSGCTAGNRNCRRPDALTGRGKAALPNAADF